MVVPGPTQNNANDGERGKKPPCNMTAMPAANCPQIAAKRKHAAQTPLLMAIAQR